MIAGLKLGELLNGVFWTYEAAVLGWVVVCIGWPLIQVTNPILVKLGREPTNPQEIMDLPHNAVAFILNPLGMKVNSLNLSEKAGSLILLFGFSALLIVLLPVLEVALIITIAGTARFSNLAFGVALNPTPAYQLVVGFVTLLAASLMAMVSEEIKDWMKYA